VSLRIYYEGMDNRRDGQTQRIGTDSGRRKRLASALRANLLRRKMQAQARSRNGEHPGQEDDAGARESPDPDPSHDSAEIIPDKTNG
jgi:hypothetical protein